MKSVSQGSKGSWDEAENHLLSKSCFPPFPPPSPFPISSFLSSSLSQFLPTCLPACTLQDYSVQGNWYTDTSSFGFKAESLFGTSCVYVALCHSRTTWLGALALNTMRFYVTTFSGIMNWSIHGEVKENEEGETKLPQKSWNRAVLRCRILIP